MSFENLRVFGILSAFLFATFILSCALPEGKIVSFEDDEKEHNWSGDDQGGKDKDAGDSDDDDTTDDDDDNSDDDTTDDDDNASDDDDATDDDDNDSSDDDDATDDDDNDSSDDDATDDDDDDSSDDDDDTTDAGTTDAGADAGQQDAGTTDAGVDAGTDAGVEDAGSDAGSDAGEQDAGVNHCPANVVLSEADLPCYCGNSEVVSLPINRNCKCQSGSLNCVIPPTTEVCDGKDNDGNGKVDDVKGETGGFDGLRFFSLPGGTGNYVAQTPYGQIPVTVTYTQIDFIMEVKTNSKTDAHCYSVGGTTMTITSSSSFIGGTCEMRIVIDDRGKWSEATFIGDKYIQARFCCPDGITVEKLNDLTSISVSGKDIICSQLNSPEMTSFIKQQIMASVQTPFGNCP